MGITHGAFLDDRREIGPRLPSFLRGGRWAIRDRVPYFDDVFICLQFCDFGVLYHAPLVCYAAWMRGRLFFLGGPSTALGRIDGILPRKEHARAPSRRKGSFRRSTRLFRNSPNFRLSRRRGPDSRPGGPCGFICDVLGKPSRISAGRQLPDRLHLRRRSNFAA